MPTTPEQIDLWRKSPSEHQRLEFKEAKAQFDNHELHEYCVALANEGGGFLVLDVADRRRHSSADRRWSTARGHGFPSLQEAHGVGASPRIL
jgi:predicted HTH transcriptional regulator